MNGVVPVDAATIMGVRDGPSGIEVLMVRRADRAAFAAGALVFPGGIVEESDVRDAEAGRVRGRDPAEAARLIGSGAGLAFWMAAVREAFEESGILLAIDEDGKLAMGLPPDRIAEARRRMAAGEIGFAEWLAGLGAHVDAGRIEYAARFVTPSGLPRRFDTRFFVAQAPDGGEAPVHDETETAEALWIRPRAALDGHGAGTFTMLPPTIWNLRRLEAAGSAAAALALARSQDVRAIEPEVVPGEDGSLKVRIEDALIDLVVRGAGDR